MQPPYTMPFLPAPPSPWGSLAFAAMNFTPPMPPGGPDHGTAPTPTMPPIELTATPVVGHVLEPAIMPS